MHITSRDISPESFFLFLFLFGFCVAVIALATYSAQARDARRETGGRIMLGLLLVCSVSLSALSALGLHANTYPAAYPSCPANPVCIDR